MVEMSTQVPVPWHGAPIEPLEELLVPLLAVVPLLDEALDELGALPPAPVPALPLAVLLALLLFVPLEPPEPPLPEVDPYWRSTAEHAAIKANQSAENTLASLNEPFRMHHLLGAQEIWSGRPCQALREPSKAISTCPRSANR